MVAYEDLTLTIMTIDRYLEAFKDIQSLIRASIRSLTVNATEADVDHRELSALTETIDDHETLSASGFS